MPLCSRRLPLWLLLVGLLAAPNAAHAVVISPTALYLSSRQPTATITLYNGGDEPEAISLALVFGVPTTDSLGAPRVVLMDVAPDGAPSALGWVRLFPRQLTLLPGGRQVVRLIAQPPPGLGAGEYWARLVVSAEAMPDPGAAGKGGAQVAIRTETVVPVTFRGGAVATGLDVAQATAQRADSSVVLTLDLARTGNAAFQGRVVAELLTAEGRRVGEATRDFPVYHTFRVRLPVPLAAHVSGPLRVRYRIDNQRADLPEGAVLPFAPYIDLVAVADAF